MKKLAIIDGYGLMNSMYFQAPAILDGEEKNRNALFSMIHLISDEIISNEYNGVCFVWGECPYYTMPEQLKSQIEQLKKVLETNQMASVETTDTVWHSVEQIIQNMKGTGFNISIYTNSETMLSFVEKNTKVYLLKVKDNAINFQEYDEETFTGEYKISPVSMNEVKILTGEIRVNSDKAVMDYISLFSKCVGKDSAIVEIGKGYALRLIREFGTIDDIYDCIDQIESPVIARRLLENKDVILKRVDIWKGSKAKIEIDTECFLFDADHFHVDGFLKGDSDSTEEKEALIKNPVTPRYSFQMKVERVENITHANTIWEAAMKDELVSIQTFYKQAEETTLLASSDGQMYLQFGEDKKDNTLLIALTTTSFPNIVFVMSTKSSLTEAYLTEKLSEYMMHAKGELATFDIKSQFPVLLGEKKDQFDFEKTGHCFDTKIAAYLLNPLKSDYQVSDISKEYLNLELPAFSDIFGKADVMNAFDTQYDQLVDYFAKQVWVAFLSKKELDSKLVQNGMKKLFHDIEMPLAYVLFEMEQDGIKIKPEALKQYGEELQVSIDALESKIYDQAGEKFNINSPKQLGEVLFEHLDLPGGKKTKTGYSTAADVLEKLSADYPIVNDILEYRQVSKLKSTYADGLLNYVDDENRIHTNFNQTITATGRLSSTEPNLQNIPMRMELGRKIRKVFVPKDEYVFMDADYSQIELRVLAHMSGDEKLIEAYHMSEDIHRVTASQVFHVPFEEVTDLQRRNAKAVNFGIVYGISAFGLSQDLSISRAEATQYIDRYFETYPGVKEYIDKLVSDAKISGQSVSMFGRIRPIPELQSSNYMQRQFGERVAMNAPIQGTAADIIKIAMVKVYRELKKAMLKSRLILQIHDELLIETAPDEVEQVRNILSTQMQQAAQLAVTLEIDLHTGNDWYEAK